MALRDSERSRGQRLQTVYQAAGQRLGLVPDPDQFKKIFLPLTDWLTGLTRESRVPPVIGISGAQGSGKTTLCTILQALLAASDNLRVAAFSLDDLYLPREDRQRLARQIHPLFATRGVPGSHDVELGRQLLSDLQNSAHHSRTAIPVFDKAQDDRKHPAEWKVWEGRCDLILFEGWCLGARPQQEPDLAEPMNQLERDEDPDCRWRRYVNRQLAGPYRELFNGFDQLMLLQVPDWNCVFSWRRNQERQLAASQASTSTEAANRIMDDSTLARFIMHFERLTRWILTDLPDQADLLLPLDQNQRFREFKLRSRS